MPFTTYKQGATWYIFDTVARVSYKVGRSDRQALDKCRELNKP